MQDAAELQAHFAEFGQSHVFRFWDQLDDAGRARLSFQAADIDLAALAGIQASLGDAAGVAPRPLEPIEAERLPGHGGDADRAAQASARGDEILASGRVAALVVAGGQGTRLGFDGPKGAYPIGPVSDRSLFEIQAQKIRGLRRRTGRDLPWCVMTSSATDEATRAFFRKNEFFGLPERDVLFFCQGKIPSLDFEGRLLLEAPDRIFENPDGHGGCLTALAASGVLEELADRGVDTVFYYQVDNPLVRMCDPTFLGYHEEAGAEFSCKVARKTDPDEKVGILARSAGHAVVVEYTELDDEGRYALDDRGELVYWAGNVAIHLLTVDFVRRVADDADRYLPFHASEKKIPHLDDAGKRVEPAAPNGHKLERFVFDALAAAERVCVVEAERSSEFSPVKNSDGTDSPATARRDLIASYHSWLRAGGIPPADSSAAIEIDHAKIDGPVDARGLRARGATDAGDAIRIASGDSV
jgi:UDP-N-acetylglucosamine/UDP-N-acetylgalactosamine diphosphorylase